MQLTLTSTLTVSSENEWLIAQFIERAGGLHDEETLAQGAQRVWLESNKTFQRAFILNPLDALFGELGKQNIVSLTQAIDNGALTIEVNVVE